MMGIYCYIDKKDNKIVYIGKDSHINKHSRHHQHCSQSHYDSQPFNRVLQNNPNRYMYQVLAWNIYSQECLNALEIQYIRQLKPKFNFTDGGDGTTGFRHSEESKRKISQANKGWKMSEEEKKRISNLHKGKTLSDEHKQKIKGENHHMWGKHHSIEVKKKISETRSLKTNKTGFYRVEKMKARSKKGFTWLYRYYNNDNERKGLSSISLKKLEQKVLLNNLE